MVVLTMCRPHQQKPNPLTLTDVKGFRLEEKGGGARGGGCVTKGLHNYSIHEADRHV